MDDITKTSLQLDLAGIGTQIADLKVAAISEERELTASEQRKVNKLEAEAGALQDRLDRDASMERELERVPRSGGEVRSAEGFIDHSPLRVSDENLRKHVDATVGGTSFGAREERANVTVATDYGSPGKLGRLPGSPNR